LKTLRIAIFFAFALAALTVASNFAHAQRVDLAFGISTLTAPGASSADSNHSPVSLTGGTYPGFSGDVEVFHHIGVGAESAPSALASIPERPAEFIPVPTTNPAITSTRISERD
jgi:hypothetical protein